MLLTILATLCYKLTLDLSELLIISNHFKTFALEMNTMKVAESYVIVALMAATLARIMPPRIRPSTVIIYLIFLIPIVPIMSLYGLQDGPRLYVYGIAVSFMIVPLMLHLLPTFEVPAQRWTPGLAVCIAATVTLVVIITFRSRLGSGLFSINLLDVYDLRDEYSESTGGLIRYFVPWQGHVINMLLLGYALYRKNAFAGAAAVLLQLVVFGATGFKSLLFLPVPIYVFIRFLRKEHKPETLLLFLLGGATSLMLLCFVAYFGFEDILSPSILLRRLFFVPGQNHLYYYDFFSMNPHVYLSNSFLSWLSPYPFDTPMETLISEIYYGTSGSANVGFLANAYAHFSYPGMILFSLLLSALLAVADAVAASMPPEVAFAVLIPPGMALWNSALFTVILTHGFGFAILLLWMVRSTFVPAGISVPAGLKGT